MIAAHVFGDHFIVLAIDNFITYIQGNKLITLQAKDQIVQFMTTIKHLAPLFQSLNKVLFYWNGSFYTWSKRFFNIKYVSIMFLLNSIMLLQIFNFRFMQSRGIVLNDHCMYLKLLV